MVDTQKTTNGYRCAICNQSFYTLDAYVSHVAECGAKLQKKEKEYLDKVNAELSKVKAAQDYAKDCLKQFKEKYPREYELNFGKKDANKDANKDKDNIKPTKSDKCSSNCKAKYYTNISEADIRAFERFLTALLDCN